MNKFTEQYFKNMEIINRAYSVSLNSPQQTFRTDIFEKTQNLADSYNNLIQKSYAPTVELVQQINSNFNRYSDSTFNIQRQMEFTQFYMQQAVIWSEFNNDIHEIVNEIDSACFNLSLVEDDKLEEIVPIKNESFFDNFKFLIDPKWHIEQIFSVIAQVVYQSILMYLLGLIAIDTLKNLLQFLLDYLLEFLKNC
jgi:hypothetical protein|nr:MAG TPA: hypothetical protein [Caudoviricetes sp.]DAQ82527.1 MAG TPA: hypothetical protein [Caudoviricetes sp.]DAS69365.1 MAG TPA: hypothetical protein [Caudoviricetes sp.]